MSLLSPPTVPLDRRQSPTALTVARGTQRLLLALGLSCVGELALVSGRGADLVAAGGSGDISERRSKTPSRVFRRRWKTAPLQTSWPPFVLPPPGPRPAGSPPRR